MCGRGRERLHGNGGSGRCRRGGGGCAACGGDGVSGRGQFQQSADGPGHLGEPSLLQDVERKTQLTLHRQTPQKKTREAKRKKNKTTEQRVNVGQNKGMDNRTVTMATGSLNEKPPGQK